VQHCPQSLRATSRIRCALLLVLGLTVSGCGAGPVETFDLSAQRAARGQLLIAEPVASAPLDGDRVVVRPAPEQVATLKGAQWRERLPRLVQTRLVQSFENTGALKAVGRSDSRLASDWSLATELRRFEVDVVSGEAVVEVAAKLVHEASGRVRSTQVFEARVPAQAEAGSAVPALDRALGDVMAQLVPWALRGM
jgi:cholesterol transport system auxiliary component